MSIKADTKENLRIQLNLVLYLLCSLLYKLTFTKHLELTIIPLEVQILFSRSYFQISFLFFLYWKSRLKRTESKPPNFIDKGMEAQKGQATFPRSQSHSVPKQRPKARLW